MFVYLPIVLFYCYPHVYCHSRHYHWRQYTRYSRSWMGYVTLSVDTRHHHSGALSCGEIVAAILGSGRPGVSPSGARSASGLNFNAGLPRGLRPGDTPCCCCCYCYYYNIITKDVVPRDHCLVFILNIDVMTLLFLFLFLLNNKKPKKKHFSFRFRFLRNKKSSSLPEKEKSTLCKENIAEEETQRKNLENVYVSIELLNVNQFSQTHFVAITVNVQTKWFLIQILLPGIIELIGTQCRRELTWNSAIDHHDCCHLYEMVYFTLTIMVAFPNAFQ